LYKSRFHLIPRSDMGASEQSVATDGGSAGAGATEQQQAGGQQGSQSEQGQHSGGSDKGFPESTPVKDMTVDQQLAYYRYQNRQSDNKLGAFKGVTPQQVQQQQEELEALRNEKLTTDQKAVKEADKAARAAADAEWLPRLQTAQLRSVAGELLKGDELESWMFGRNPAAFANDNGDIDADKVKSILTASAAGGGQQQQSNGQQQRAWGQTSGGTQVLAQPGAGGQAAAAKRFGTTT
jgi:hypothetical protein